MLDNLKEFIAKRRSSQQDNAPKQSDEKLAARLDEILPKKSHEVEEKKGKDVSESRSESGDLH